LFAVLLPVSGSVSQLKINYEFKRNAKAPKLAALMDETEADVLTFMTFSKDHPAENPIPQSARKAQRRDQTAAPRCLASSQRGRLCASSARSCSHTTTNGKFSAAAT
jgi:hypothetical protein